MRDPSVQRVTSTGVTFKGKGANESLRVYLYPCKGEWSATLKNNVEGGKTVESKLNTDRILYFRLKSSQYLTIKCSTNGMMKVL